MRRIALLLVTGLALATLAVPAIAQEAKPEAEGGPKVDPKLEEQLRYGKPAEDKAISDDERKEALAAVAAEPSMVPVVIGFGMFAVVMVVIGGGVVVYRRA